MSVRRILVEAFRLQACRLNRQMVDSTEAMRPATPGGQDAQTEMARKLKACDPGRFASDFMDPVCALCAAPVHSALTALACCPLSSAHTRARARTRTHTHARTRTRTHAHAQQPGARQTRTPRTRTHAPICADQGKRTNICGGINFSITVERTGHPPLTLPRGAAAPSGGTFHVGTHKVPPVHWLATQFPVSAEVFILASRNPTPRARARCQDGGHR